MQPTNIAGTESCVLYLQLATLIVRRVEFVLYNSSYLTSPIWDCLLEFALAVNHAVLSVPSSTHLDQPADSETASNTVVAKPFSQLQPWMRGMLQLDCLVVTMLIRVWLRALAQHYPRLAYWQGLEQLHRSARHRVALVYQWSRQIVAFTFNLLKPNLTTLSTPSLKAPVTEPNAGLVSNHLSGVSIFSFPFNDY